MDSSPAPRAAYQRDCTSVLEELAVDLQRGLSSAEVSARLAQHGRNELQAEPPVSAWRKFFAQFEDMLVVLLLVATAISLGLWYFERESPLPYEAIAIFAVVLFNALMGFFQEARAESAVASLKQLTAAKAHVLRDGQRQSVDSRELVPGDILVVEEGDRIGADARILEATSLALAEAALTGESVPVEKSVDTIAADVVLGERSNMLYSGTAVTYGRGRAVVTATGMHTEIGRIAGMLRAVNDEVTPLQKQLDRVGKMLGLVVIATALIMIVTIVVVENVRSWSGVMEVLILGVALAVAAVPEGLPAVVTAVLSLGVQRMARRNAIVRHLRAVETLGSADVIASDKTGTLTKNEMTVRSVVTASGEVTLSGIGYVPEGELQAQDGSALAGALRAELERALCAADRANNAALQEQAGRFSVQGDPTEGALLVAARKAGLDARALEERLPRVAEVPFSSERKLMSTVHTDADDRTRLVVFCKGAPDVLLERCVHELRDQTPEPLTPERRVQIMVANEALAGRGLRTLGVAFRSLPISRREPLDARVEHDLVFAGLIGMIDPPREEARVAVARAHSAGIRTIMITGDHPKTAGVIARDLGMVEEARVVTGRELVLLSEADLDRTVREVSVYARVDPEHKLRIVEALGRQGAVVAMTGDGVNDAPALKRADIGVAMGITGTDVSKDAADMILVDDNFASIVAAVEEGRAIFSNIRKFLRYLLSSNIGEVLTMFFGVVLAMPLGLYQPGQVTLPLLATQLLWINLVTDGAPALALGVEPPHPKLMSRPPRNQAEGVITARMWLGIGLVGAAMAVVTLTALDMSLPGGFIAGSGELRYAQTMAFNTLMLCQMFNVLNARSDEDSAFARILDNGYLWAALLGSVLLQLAVIYVPTLQRAFSTTSLSAVDWAKCAGLASVVLWTRELAKLIVRIRAQG